jgi:hypothetical protein
VKRVGAAVLEQAGDAAVAVKDAVGTVVEKVQERVSEFR